MRHPDDVPAVGQRITVRLSPDDAFALFTRGMRAWRPFAGHSCANEPGGDVEFEPRLGGAVTEVAVDRRRWARSRVQAWEPRRAFAMSWHPGLEEETP